MWDIYPWGITCKNISHIFGLMVYHTCFRVILMPPLSSPRLTIQFHGQPWDSTVHRQCLPSSHGWPSFFTVYRRFVLLFVSVFFCPSFTVFTFSGVLSPLLSRSLLIALFILIPKRERPRRVQQAQFWWILLLILLRCLLHQMPSRDMRKLQSNPDRSRRSVYRTDDILSLFNLLIQSDWKSFLFISGDNHELAVRLFYVNLSCPMFFEGEKSFLSRMP